MISRTLTLEKRQTTRKQPMILDRIQNLEERVANLSAYSSPFAASSPIAPLRSIASELIDRDPSPFSFLFDTRGLKVSREDIATALKRDGAPIPAEQNCEGYGGDNDLHYWISGYAEYLKLSAIAKKHGVEGGSLFDFGGSTGRVFRNFHYQGGWDVWSSDFKRSSVEWNLSNFPTAIKVFQGLYQPTLPMESKSVDLVIAMSVFTHIDETETNWLLELRRILKPGGIALITTHNEATWQNMPSVLRAVVEEHSPELASQSSLPSGRHVSNFRTDDPYRCNVFHSDDYIRGQWSRYFDVLDILPKASDNQAIVVLRR